MQSTGVDFEPGSGAKMACSTMIIEKLDTSLAEMKAFKYCVNLL